MKRIEKINTRIVYTQLIIALVSLLINEGKDGNTMNIIAVSAWTVMAGASWALFELRIK